MSKALRNLDEVNAEAQRLADEHSRTDIACPQCGSALTVAPLGRGPMFEPLVHVNVWCTSCGWKGELKQYTGEKK